MIEPPLKAMCNSADGLSFYTHTVHILSVPKLFFSEIIFVLPGFLFKHTELLFNHFNMFNSMRYMYNE